MKGFYLDTRVFTSRRSLCGELYFMLRESWLTGKIFHLKDEGGKKEKR